MSVVVITGGSDGVGKEIARTLATEYTVVIIADSEEKLKNTALELKCDYTLCDVTNPKSIDDTVATILAKYQYIDCLVNSAGVWIEGEIETNSVEAIQKVIAVNTLGTVFFTRAVVHSMKDRKKGKIVNIISGAGLKAKPKRSVYTASKYAVTGFTESMQQELAPFGITVTGVYPGKLNTKLFEKQGITKLMDDALDPKEVAKTVSFILSLPDTTVIPKITVQHILELAK
jgi:uncharacterized protein